MSTRSSRRKDAGKRDKTKEEEKEETDAVEEEQQEEAVGEEKEDEKSAQDDRNEEEKHEESNDAGKAEEQAEVDFSESLEPEKPVDPKVIEEQELIKNSKPETELELALTESLKRKEAHIERLSGEVQKLKAFISKRKQTYKRKRKDEGAPTRALSAYNIFVQDRFSQLAKENEQALRSADTDAQLKRVPPASLVASTGNQWKELSAEEKAHYEERARADRKRYEDQMAKYQPPDKQANRKRNKTGYNMFFSAHVLRLKQSEAGVPSERGSVARLVGNAWKQLSAEEKQYYEREADKQNGMNPVDKDDDEEDDESKRPMGEYGHMHGVPPGEMHMHGGMPPPMGHAGGMHQGQHDPRQHPAYAYPAHHMPYGQPPYQGHHEYGGQGHHSRYHQGGRAAHGYQGQNYPAGHAHPYDQRGMGM